ncbi:MAG: nucleoside kinase [Chloroflexi bacterium]|nr:nucleoside kinase [Chloroflexota bacterium]
MEIRETSLSPDVEVLLPDGRVYTGPRGSTLETFFKAMPDWHKLAIVGGIVNSELRELTYPINMDARVQPVDIASADGARIYRRSVTFLLESAFEDIFPNVMLTVDHSVSSGGYYCEVTNRPPLSADELSILETRMRELVKLDMPFERQQVTLEYAMEYFQKKGQTDKTRLLKYRTKPYLILYKLGEHQDYHHGYMVPSTRYLRWFDLKPLGEGFVLRFPRRHRPNELPPLPESPTLVRSFRQYGEWLDRMGIPNVGALNDAIRDNKIHEVVLISEALHEQKISDIASQIIAHQDKIRIILIAGPSSSGKTTFSKRLSIQLLAQGADPYPVELDNFFVNREETPRDEFGEYDFESIEAVNTDLLNSCLRELIAGNEVRLPRYNFPKGVSEPGDSVKLSNNQIILLEGIHGLNPRLLEDFPGEQTHKLYVSCLTQLNLDRYNRISTTDTRLIRRIVRDSRERGYTATQTIKRWESVRRGERKYVFPYQENSNEIFNSAMAYELSALRPLAEPVLRQVPYGSPEYIESKRLLSLLEWFLPLDIDLIPDNSLLREFIGGSILKDFKLWKMR